MSRPIPTPELDAIGHATPAAGTTADAAAPGQAEPGQAGPGRRVPLSQQATEALRRAILGGRLAPGERLVEERLSAELGMSRVPIREAIKQLVAEGLAVPAESAPGGRGAQVAALSPEFALELIEVRAVLEGLNARLAARQRNPAVLAQVQVVLERGNAAANAAHGAAAGELAALNAAYHDLLATAGANRVLQDLMRPLRERTELVFRRNSTERAAADWREHAMILAAVMEGEEELAALLAARHVHRAARARLGPPRADGPPGTTTAPDGPPVAGASPHADPPPAAGRPGRAPCPATPPDAPGPDAAPGPDEGIAPPPRRA
ncbi:FCD domain-containing protein [Roseomonas sp. NAR14]|uniref:FCD domain-containing protein n=1 Tax=Roseomonas acroporae TaxID=2937791 RepID=A0A9X2BUT7_9PROT|nr:GntR family transcriptional regulator [Roseomonas acroporae]MCK8783314.1 FCD domain-containing protein [Roseomonas acroporae]